MSSPAAPGYDTGHADETVEPGWLASRRGPNGREAPIGVSPGRPLPGHPERGAGSNPAVGSFTALLLSRAARRLLLIGECPAQGGVAALDPATASGRRLRGWLSSTPADAINLCPRRWSMTMARVTARSLWDGGLLAGREVVLLGQKVARSMARLSPELGALVAAAPFSMAAPPVPTPAGGWDVAMVWTAPHPSGRNRWWNSPANRRAGELFFRYVAGRLEQPRWSPRTASDLARGALDILAEELARSENHALDRTPAPG